MDLTPLEKAVLVRISESEPHLAPLLAEVQVARREFTGAGFYSDLCGAPDGEWDRPPVSGPEIESPQLEFGGGALLWLSGGVPACLELFAYGDSFPEQLSAFALS